MSGPVLGIDLGTTNSAVAVADGPARILTDAEGNRLIPSVVSFHPSGQVIVGYDARERRLLDARNTVYSVKRLIGRPFASEEVRRACERLPFGLVEGPHGDAVVEIRGETYTLPEISAFVLRRVRDVAESALNVPCTRAVVTVPANFNELQRNATKTAGKVAGLEVLRILNEPTAAALAYGYGRGSRERIAVYDFGGGTFDLTILELAGDVFEVVATAGDTFLGGDDIDVRVAERMSEVFLDTHRYDPRVDPQAFERLRAAAEWAKCQLSGQDRVELRVEELAYDAGGAGLDLAFTLTRDELEAMISPLVARSFDVCEDAMRVASLRPTQLDNVILVGGSTRMPLVRRMVEEYFGRAPLGHIDPDLVVAQGAAVQGATLSGRAGATPPAAVGRVALKRVTRNTLPPVVEERPKGPAFAPKDQGPPELPDFAEPASIFDEPTVARRSPHSSAPPAPPPPPRPEPPRPERAAKVSVVEQRAVGVGRAPELSQATRQPVGPPPLRKERGDATQPFGAHGAPPPPIPDFPSPPTFDLPAPPSAPPPPVARKERPDGTLQMGLPARSAMPDFPAPPPPPAPAPTRPPLLLDVTPHSLGIETAGGFCEHVLKRNAAIPVEQSRVFSTSIDMQEEVHAKVCQGESRKLGENQLLGEIALVGLRPAKRGEVRIEVTFLLDSDGTLGVRAKDLDTGREQTTRIQLVGAVNEDELERMQERQQGLVG